MLKRPVILFLIVLLAAVSAAAGPSASSNAIARNIDELKSLGHRFEPVSLFAGDVQSVAARSDLQGIVSDGFVVSVNAAQIESLLNQRVTQFSLPLPDGRGLELVEVDYSRMRVEGPNGEDLSWTNTGRHYQGHVMGEPGSVAAISVYRNLETDAYEIAGVYNTADGNYMIGLLPGVNPRNEHLVYAASAMINGPSAGVECGMGEDSPAESPRKRRPVSALGERSEVPLVSLDPAPQAVAGACVRIHYEVAYDVYYWEGSNTTNYATGFFNVAKTLYANEGLPITLHYLRIWTSPDPEQSVSGYQNKGHAFGNRMSSSGIVGDLALLVAFHIDRGVARALTPICGSDYYQTAISPIRDYSSYPTFGWASSTFPHEIGHLFGSPHTQACRWNGNNTALDGCAAPEGSCAWPSSTYGTLMSYCQNYPLSNGFGSQPGNLVRSSFNNAACLVSCSSTSCSYSISPTSASYAASGGSGSVSVTATSGCSRTATSNASWITITGGASGTGSGTVSYSVAANSGASRTGTATIAGRTFTVSQSGTTTPPPTGGALTNGVGISVSGATGSQAFYYIDVPSGSSNLVIALSGGTGDADMYTRFGSAPTLTTYDCRPYASGNNETCTVATPAAGRYHILLHGYAAFSGATLRASYTTGTTSTLRVISPNGGEVWSRGSTRTVSWDKGGAARVDVALYRGTTFIQWITYNNYGTSYSWTIPTSLTASSTYTVRVIDYDVRTRTDSSDGNFTIN